MKYEEVDQLVKDYLMLDGEPLRIGDKVWCYSRQMWVKITGINLKYAKESCGSYEQSLIFAIAENEDNYGFCSGFKYESYFKAQDLHRVKIDMTFLDKVKKRLLSK